jgi:RNA polymerase sigma factor (sigma-70 family)
LEGSKRANVSSRRGFQRVYRRAYPRVYRTLVALLANPTDAADCTQDAFIRAFESWERLRRDQPLEVSIHQIAIERAATYRRKARLKSLGRLLHKLGGVRENEDPAGLDTQRTLVSALRTIHPKLAAAVVLRYYHGYTNRQIATAIGVSERTVVNNLREASERLRATFQSGLAAEDSRDSRTIPATGRARYAE